MPSFWGFWVLFTFLGLYLSIVDMLEDSVFASWCQHRGSSKCKVGVTSMSCGDVCCDVSSRCRIEILLPAFSCCRLRRSLMNVPSCCRHKCSHRLLQHLGHHLTQMCFDDGPSFFPVPPPFPQYDMEICTKYHPISLYWRQNEWMKYSKDLNTRAHQAQNDKTRQQRSTWVQTHLPHLNENVPQWISGLQTSNTSFWLSLSLLQH